MYLVGTLYWRWPVWWHLLHKVINNSSLYSQGFKKLFRLCEKWYWRWCTCKVSVPWQFTQRFWSRSNICWRFDFHLGSNKVAPYVPWVLFSSVSSASIFLFMIELLKWNCREVIAQFFLMIEENRNRLNEFDLMFKNSDEVMVNSSLGYKIICFN